MNPLDLSKVLGEWYGYGTMTIGSMQGTIKEYVRLELTDRADCLSYLRHSRILIGAQTALHNELGYMRPTDISLMLSRGSYIILNWSDGDNEYRQAAGSPDTRNMRRQVTLLSTGQMKWDASMEVQQVSAWVPHTIITTFDPLSLSVSTAHSKSEALQFARAATVSFAHDIAPLFRRIDIQHMAPRGVLLDNYIYMSDAAGDNDYPDHAHARAVYCTLTGDCQPRMPPGGPYWTPEQLSLYSQWMTGGFRP
jgi:hypothetical protein